VVGAASARCLAEGADQHQRRRFTMKKAFVVLAAMALLVPAITLTGCKQENKDPIKTTTDAAKDAMKK
jgi:hypothetical protein